MALRGFLAVLAGLGVVIIIVVVFTWATAALLRVPTNAPTTAYLIANLIISGAAAAVGGSLTGYMAPSSPVLHALGLGVLLFLLAVPMIVSGPLLGQPEWYPTAIALVGLIFAPVGGMLAARAEPPQPAPESGAHSESGPP